jgi:cohesin loading factor subunit SCC2
VLFTEPNICAVPLEKLTALIDEIFEAEDALPADAEAKDLPPELFSHLSIHCSRPLLSPTVIRKLTKYVGNVARPTKRLRQTTAGGTPGRGRGGLAEVDTQVLSRLLKHLDRSVKTGEDVDPFVAIAAPPSSAKSSPRKSSAKKGKKNEKPRTPNIDEDEDEDAEKDESGPTKSTELNEIDFDKLSRILDVARDSILAADCCIALLASDRLSKQVRVITL